MVKLGVIGDPISHSLSPIIHGAVMDYLKIPCSYEPYNVKQGELGKYIKMAKEEGLLGFNVTMPHKVDIMNFLDKVDQESLRCGSVNTVKYKDGRLHGYNTDGDGFVMSLCINEGINLQNKNVLILGAGGVARTIATKIATQNPSKIIILNRTLESAQAICELVKQKVNIDIFADKLENISEHSKTADLLVNTTPLGMHGTNKDFESLEFLYELDKSSVVYDLIYNPKETTLLKCAKEIGLKTINGLGMLIYQALIADQIYLEEELDFEVLNKVVRWNL